MFIFVCLFLPPLIVGIILIVKNSSNLNLFKEHPQALQIALGATILPVILFFALNMYQVFTNYRGVCAGPPDYTAPCTFMEYLSYSFSPAEGANIFGYVFLCLLSVSWGSLAFGLTSLYFSKK